MSRRRRNSSPLATLRRLQKAKGPGAREIFQDAMRDYGFEGVIWAKRTETRIPGTRVKLLRDVKVQIRGMHLEKGSHYDVYNNDATHRLEAEISWRHIEETAQDLANSERDSVCVYRQHSEEYFVVEPELAAGQKGEVIWISQDNVSIQMRGATSTLLDIDPVKALSMFEVIGQGKRR